MGKKVRFSVCIREEQYDWLKKRASKESVNMMVRKVLDWAMDASVKKALRTAKPDLTIDRSCSQEDWSGQQAEHRKQFGSVEDIASRTNRAGVPLLRRGSEL